MVKEILEIHSSGCTYTFKSHGDGTAPLTMMRGSNPVVLYNDASTPMNKADNHKVAITILVVGNTFLLVI